MITGTLSPDAKGNSPLGAIWESSTASPSDGNLSFFTSPGGSYLLLVRLRQPDDGAGDDDGPGRLRRGHVVR